MIEILGKWVRNADVDPQTNIQGREWMTEDGTMHGVGGLGGIPAEAYIKGILWHFTPEQCVCSKSDS